jgi:hypothetical protein
VNQAKGLSDLRREKLRWKGVLLARGTVGRRRRKVRFRAREGWSLEPYTCMSLVAGHVELFVPLSALA